MKNEALQRLLRARVNEKTGRRMTVTALAALAGCGRSHLHQVLKNAPGRGGLTRRRLFPHLTLAEVRLLGWEAEYGRWREKMRGKEAARGCSTKNSVPIATLNESINRESHAA